MDLKQIQHLLAYLGYYSIAVDGVPGPGTLEAIRAFQRDLGLQADGIAGLKTQAALKQAISEDRLLPRPADFWDTVSYFRREEFRCPCGKCGGFPVEPEKALVTRIDHVRAHYGVPVTLSSGVRCKSHNQSVGGVSNSRHLLGKAVDFTVSGVPSHAVVSYVRSMEGVRYVYAIDGSYVHMDVA